MTAPPQPTTTGTIPPTAPANRPPLRSKVTGGLAVVACVACCAVPVLLAVGLLTGAGAALLQQTLLAVAVGLGTLALGMWWLHHRRTRRAPAGGHDCTDGHCTC